MSHADNYRRTLNTWNSIASLYEEIFMDLGIYNESYDAFCSGLNSDQTKILEIGCGPGNITKYLQNKRSDFDIHATDASPKMLELAKKNVPTASFSLLDARALDTLTNNYDGIVNGFCLPYLDNNAVLEFIRNAYQLLHKNGLLYLSFIKGDYEKSGLEVGSSGDGCYVYYYQKSTVSEALINAGFSILKDFEIAYPKQDKTIQNHIVLLAKKN